MTNRSSRPVREWTKWCPSKASRTAATRAQQGRAEHPARGPAHHEDRQRAQQRHREPPAERAGHAEQLLADGDQPLADRRVHHEVGGVTEDARRAVGEHHVRLLDRVRHPALVAVLQQRPGLLDVVRLVEHELVRPAELPEPQEAADRRDQAAARASPRARRSGGGRAGGRAPARSGTWRSSYAESPCAPLVLRAAPAGPRRRPDPAAHASCPLSPRWMSRGRLYRRT